MADEVCAFASGSAKKRVKNQNKWKKTIRKDCKNRGLKYVNTKNQQVCEKSEPNEVCQTKYSCLLSKLM